MSNPFLNELRYQLSKKSSLILLILINLFVFLAIGITMTIGHLSKADGPVSELLIKIFMLNGSPKGFLHAPWGIVTSIFAHFDVLHFLFNMLFLYFSGRMFLQFFTSRRLLHLYVVGGIAGGLLEIAAHSVFPGLSGHETVIVGASGSVMSIFMAMAFYKPNLEITLFGGINIRLILIAGIYLLLDVVGLANDDGTAHFAHLGGALIGFLSVTNLNSSRNIINMSESFGQRFKKFWSGIFKPGPRMKVERGGRPKTDEQFNLDKKARQEKTNKILDKISKSGYESLSKAEKEFLFSQSQK